MGGGGPIIEGVGCFNAVLNIILTVGGGCAWYIILMKEVRLYKWFAEATCMFVYITTGYETNINRESVTGKIRVPRQVQD